MLKPLRIVVAVLYTGCSCLSGCGKSDDGAKTYISVPMQNTRGVYTVPVSINDSLTINFIVDSGATDVNIPADVVMTLVRTGTVRDEDFLGTQMYTMADGSTVPSNIFRIRSLQVGNIVVKNVVASIGDVRSTPLLGQSFLGHFKSWSVDNDNHALVLLGSGGSVSPPSSTERTASVGKDSNAGTVPEASPDAIGPNPEEFSEKCDNVSPKMYNSTTNSDNSKGTEFPLPKGWHEVLNLSELDQDELSRQSRAEQIKKDGTDALRAKADFDGDGRTDIARILESNDIRHCHRVFMTYFPNGKATHYNLGSSEFVYEVKPSDWPHGIETWCGLSGDCEAGESKKIKLQRPAISLGEWGSVSRIVLWDDNRKSWISVVTGD